MTRARQLALISYDLKQAAAMLLAADAALEGVAIPEDLTGIQEMAREVLSAAACIKRGVENGPGAPPIPPAPRPSL
jgi:hypothetical protein